MADASWYRLDNVGKFYAAQAGGNTQTIFRIAATMADEVDADALQRALDAAVALFPGFNVCLRNGLFWHYLVPAPNPPRVEPEVLPVCYNLHADPSSVLFRVTYHARRINVEVSHIISDGRGTLEFVKALLAAYVEARYGAPAAPAPYAGTEASKTEDSFSAHYDRAAAGTDAQPQVFHLTGWKNADDPVYLELHYPADAVHAAAKAAGATVTSYLIAAVICALRREMHGAERERAIHMDVPVDLRALFGSTTLRNFFGLAYVTYVPGDADEPVAVIAAEVQQQLAAGTQPASLKRRVMRMVKLEKNPLVRAVPLIVKDAALGFAAWRATREVTCTVSSLGRVQLDDAVAPYVEGISALTSPAGLNFILCTCGNDLCIGISSRFVSLRTARHLVDVLAAEGLHGWAALNKDDAQVDAALRESALEDRLAAIGATWRDHAGRAPARDQGRVEVRAKGGRS
ncbi:alcohol acetyltransferase [uncultured Adlercreutzia sp.]|uniref:phthiocerol/phthiodiolone dimycocerosyl transferase family protein n=1 Tax=uncultured Adlercreutzia sp. TaxID=875803 RepID=UPI0026768439|nr:alcohol acetyltransferase [uncultured Adlercreutzia sp.]